MKRPKLILFTGAPCSGKTRTLNDILNTDGIGSVYIVPEAPTYLCSGNPPLHNKPDFSSPDQLETFDCLIYHSRVLSAIQARKMDVDYVLFDRGTLDGLVYSESLLSKVGTSIEAELQRYDGVLLMRTLAESGKYTTENNSCRTETEEEALLIQNKTRSIYKEHPNYYEIYAHLNSVKRSSIAIRFIENLKIRV